MRLCSHISSWNDRRIDRRQDRRQHSSWQESNRNDVFPKGVFIDVDLLSTLHEEELLSGFSEMIKHALIGDEDQFTRFEKEDILTLNEADISRSLTVKKMIVREDPFEKGVRSVLNFGHTIGHGIERSKNYTISHGKAVAAGMLVESYLSHILGHLSEKSFKRIQLFLEKVFFFSFELQEKEILKNALFHDKKRKGGVLHFVLLKDIGRPFFEGKKYSHPVDDPFLDRALDWMFASYPRHKIEPKNIKINFC